MKQARDSQVEFICHPDKHGEIPEPKASSNVFPEWYKRLQMLFKNDDGISERTVRTCPAFLDALTLGWILPAESNIKIDTVDPDDGPIEWDDGGANIISDRTIGTGELPKDTVGSFQLHSSWAAKVPDGYSILVLPPLNRRETRYTVVAQLIDADENLSTIDIPVLWHADNGKTIIRKGDPIAQVIPLNRESRLRKALARPFRDGGYDSYGRIITRSKTNRSWYRKEAWNPKSSMMINTNEI